MNFKEFISMLTQFGAEPSKKFSQNFLFDKTVLDDIAWQIPKGSTHYIEIGGGAGTLTLSAIEKDLKPLTVIDLDDRMISLLKYRFENEKDVKIIKDNGATLNFNNYADSGRVTVFGNLPYQVSSPILINTISQSSCIDSAVFLLQKEVAEKVVSKPESRLFSPIAALVQMVGDAEIVMEIPPEKFYPAPKVFSSLIKINFKEHSINKEELIKYASVFRIIFSHRRKTLSNVFKINRLPIEIINQCDIDPLTRIEQLEWSKLVMISSKIREII